MQAVHACDMADAATQMNTARNLEFVAPLGVLILMSSWADLSELAFLVAFMGLRIFLAKDGTAFKLPDAFWQHSMVVAIKDHGLISWIVALFIAAPFAFAIGVPTQQPMVLMSVGTYFVLMEVGELKPHKSKEAGEWPSVTKKHKAASPKYVKPRTRANPRSARAKGYDQVMAEAPDGLEAQADAFVKAAAPNSGDQFVLRELEKAAKKCILPVVPEAKIKAVANFSLSLADDLQGKPEMEMVVTCDPQILRTRLAALSNNSTKPMRRSCDTLGPEVLQKTAAKVLSGRLTFVRFWRSQCKGPEAKIVVLVLDEFGFCAHPFLMNFQVNAPYPLRIAKLLSTGTQTQTYLTTLVVRWARNRAISNSSKGQPPSYAWALMVAYFMRQHHGALDKNIIQCFLDFVSFFVAQFNVPQMPAWCLSCDAPDRDPVDKLLGIPYIEDPFDAQKTPSEWMTVEGVERVKEELVRAASLLSCEDATFAELMQHWVPEGKIEAL